MPIRCPTCSRVNPASAAYCYYDGRGLTDAARDGPLGLGTMPFPMPFSFSDGHGCSNYNQLVLACDRRWSEARNYLANGTWKSFFGAIGRADLANLAKQSADQPDADAGLCRLLEGLPADAEALRPAKLALASTEEDLGTLTPGADHKINLVIENQGMLLLSGSITSDCDWLSFGDHQGTGSSKLFQTRDTYTLPVRVLGSKLRAGKQPLEGQIVVDTNGGRQTFTVRATVPIRPFPRRQGDKGILSGAASPREIALKAKAHPQEAAALFEQGAVKVWYESNGWTYPVRGTQAKGKGALQQFFEALGLSKPPRLEIDTQQIECRGEVGEQVTKKLIVRTAEAKFVYAEVHSNREWIKILPPIPQGKAVMLPVRIEIPPRPGETLDATLTVLGNGQQRFVVPVTVAVEASVPEPDEATVSLTRWVTGIFAGIALFLCIAIPVALLINHRRSKPASAPTEQVVAPVETQPAPKVETWWDGIPQTSLAASVERLKKSAGENRPIFERLEGKSDTARRAGYEQLAVKLPELARNLDTREALGRFVTECCVYEPSELNINPLLRGLAHQFPAEDTAFPPEDKGGEVERAAFWLQVVCDTLAHQAARPNRSQSLVSELNIVLGATLDAALPPNEFKEQAEKALGEQCYRNLRPTAEKSVEQALAIRDVLIGRFPRQLKPEFRESEDMKLLAIGLTAGAGAWPTLEPLFKAAVESNALDTSAKLIDLYEKANAEMAGKMEVLLAARWKAAANPRLNQAARAAAIRKRLTAARIPYAERVKRLQDLLARTPLSPAKVGKQPRTTPLQDSVRLAHASTMADILFNKEADVERFDELIGRIPGSEPDKPAEDGMAPGKMPDERPKPANTKEVIDLSTGNYVVQEELTDKCDLDPRRDTYRKVYSVSLKAGEIYVLDMRSNDLTPYLRVETRTGARVADERGTSLHLVFTPPAGGVYRVVVSSVDKKAVGKFTLQIAKQQIIRYGMGGFPPPWARPRPFGSRPRRMPVPGGVAAPNPPAEATKTVDQEAPVLNPGDLADLVHRQSNVRIAAFKNLARGLPDDLPYRQAQKIATYLLLTEWGDASDAEMEAVKVLLPPLARCRHLLEALADVVANTDRLAQARTEAIVGGLLGQQLRFARDEDWRLACRKLLLQRSVDLSGPANNEADRTAEFLRDLYKEQGLALGLETPEFQDQSKLAIVLERLIQHVADRAAPQKLAPEDTDYLGQVGRQLQATRFAAANDLEHVVLLQRIWLRVLVLALQERVPDEVQKAIRDVQQQLDKKDREASNLLDQLRSGEENILRVWALALDLKLQ